jgi:hypothetical protein
MSRSLLSKPVDTEVKVRPGFLQAELRA